MKTLYKLFEEFERSRPVGSTVSALEYFKAGMEAERERARVLEKALEDLTNGYDVLDSERIARQALAAYRGEE